MATANLELRKLDTMVVTLTITREFRIRVWLATMLLRIAAWILGGRSELKVDTGDAT